VHHLLFSPALIRILWILQNHFNDAVPFTNINIYLYNSILNSENKQNIKL
jgi:hypothetical protein